MEVVTAFELQTSESTDKLDTALAKAQGALGVAKKDKINHFKNTYAGLPSILEACREALAQNGISVTQFPVHSTDDRVHLITRIACSGQWMLCRMSMPVSKKDPQGYGSALTYLKRYCLEAVLTIASDDDDDDGNRASESPGVRKLAYKPALLSASEQPQPYRVPFTKSPFCGKTLEEIPLQELVNYREKLLDFYHGKEMPPDVAHFSRLVDAQATKPPKDGYAAH